MGTYLEKHVVGLPELLVDNVQRLEGGRAESKTGVRVTRRLAKQVWVDRTACRKNWFCWLTVGSSFFGDTTSS
jgi:hypothetical protein